MHPRRLRLLPAPLVAAGAAVVWAALVLVGAYTVPVYDGPDATVVAVNGEHAAAVLALPLAGALLTAWLLARRLAGGGDWTLLAAFCLAIGVGALGLVTVLLPAVLPVGVLLAVGAALVASRAAPDRR